MTRPRAAPYIWVTWLSRLLVGDDSCVWSSWFRAHHENFNKTDSSSFDLVKWRVAHTGLVRRTIDGLRSSGHIVTMEEQNAFRLKGSSGATLAGKADIVATAPDGSVTVYDAKTGAQKASDAAQVMIYQYALAREKRYRGLPIEGRLVYGDGAEVSLPAGSLDADFVNSLHDLLGRMSGSEPAERVPSRRECAWCPLTAEDCPERIEGP